MSSKVASKGTGSKTIHYHHDTKVVAEKLTKGQMYRTSKGVGRFKGRSWSNGKLQFIGSGGVSIYFTLQEWKDGNNSPENVDKKLGKEMEKQVRSRVEDRFKDAVDGLKPYYTILRSTAFNQDVVYEGVDPELGARTRSMDVTRAVVYYPASMVSKFPTVGVLSPELRKQLYPKLN